MMEISTTLAALGARPDDVRRYAVVLAEAMQRRGIDTLPRMAHFLGQVMHESGRLRRVEESLYYSAGRLLAVFPRYFTAQEAQAYAMQPARIAARVYGGRMGNGAEASGDGWRFRGRGLIQLTGRDNYAAYGEDVGVDLMADPDRVARLPYAADVAGWYWQRRDLNRWADRSQTPEDRRAACGHITRAINGGYNGLDDRLWLTLQAWHHLEASAAPPPRVRPRERPPAAIDAPRLEPLPPEEL